MQQLLFLLILAYPIISLGQHEEKTSHHEHNEKGIFEIITTGINAYPIGEGPRLWGGEAHFTYWFIHEYGTGISYTLRSEEGAFLNDIALLASWNPTNWMTVNVGPNFALANEHRDFALLAYAETEFNLRLAEWFHVGPVVGTLLGKHSEYSFGFHLGFEFPSHLKKDHK